MEEVLTETEIRTLYEKRQAEPFPRRKNVMGIMLAIIFLLGTIAVWCAFLWLLSKIAA
jgi:flagellar basal body-associated protein FliL